MQRMIHQSQSLEWKDGFNSVYPLPATSITSILTLWQLAVGIHNNILVILCLSASLALFKSCLIRSFQLYFLTELVVISSSLDFFFFSFGLRHGAGLKACGMDPSVAGLTTTCYTLCQRKILQQIIVPLPLLIS